MKTTEDAYLDGKVLLMQPEKGYRAGTDAVFLAASIRAKAPQKVLDVGCGVGAALLCLNARVPDLQVTGLELQPELTKLAKENAKSFPNIQIFEGNLETFQDVEKNTFDHVISNPPYLPTEKAWDSENAIKSTAHFESMPLSKWIQKCLAFVKPKGFLTLIQRADRLDDILKSITLKKYRVQIYPLWSKAGEPAKRVILRIQKDSGAPTELLPGLIVHTENGYSETAEDTLRHGKPLIF